MKQVTGNAAILQRNATILETSCLVKWSLIQDGFINITKVYKTEIMVVGIRHADHATPSIRKSWHELSRQAVVARSI
jgi:hypothetical protein